MIAPQRPTHGDPAPPPEHFPDTRESPTACQHGTRPPPVVRGSRPRTGTMSGPQAKTAQCRCAPPNTPKHPDHVYKPIPPLARAHTPNQSKSPAACQQGSKTHTRGTWFKTTHRHNGWPAGEDGTLRLNSATTPTTQPTTQNDLHTSPVPARTDPRAPIPSRPEPESPTHTYQQNRRQPKQSRRPPHRIARKPNTQARNTDQGS